MPLFAQSVSDAQGKIQIYAFVVECPMRQCNISGDIKDSSWVVAPANARFIVVEYTPSYCVLRFTLLPNRKKTTGLSMILQSDINSYAYFLITREQINYKAIPIRESEFELLVGNILMPIKLRFNPFDFNKDFSIGTTLGCAYRYSKKQELSVGLLVGVGLSNIQIDSANTKGKISNTNDALSFTFSIGFVMEFGHAQVGIFTGLDMLNATTQQKYDWHYMGKPWFSFGIGYSLFSFNVNNNKSYINKN